MSLFFSYFIAIHTSISLQNKQRVYVAKCFQAILILLSNTNFGPIENMTKKKKQWIIPLCIFFFFFFFVIFKVPLTKCFDILSERFIMWDKQRTFDSVQILTQEKKACDDLFCSIQFFHSVGYNVISFYYSIAYALQNAPTS